MNRLIILSFIFSFNVIFAQSGKGFYNLEECLSIAEKNNFDIELSTQQIISSKADVRNAFGNYLPSISYNMGYSRQLNQQESGFAFIDGQLVPVTPNPNSFNMNALARVNIFDGFGREGNFQRADNNHEANILSKQQTMQDVLMSVYSRYIDVIRNYQVVKIRNENLELSKKDRDRIQAEVESGVLPKANLYSQIAEISNREVELINAENQLNSSKADLLTIMGLMPNINTEFSQESLPDNVSEKDINEFRSQIGSLDYAMKRALDKRLDLKASRKYLESAKGNLIMSKSSYMPILSASGGWNWSNSELNAFDENGRSYIGLNLSVPLFQNFNVNRNIQQAKLQITQQEIILKQAEQNVRNSVQQAYLNLESAEKSLESSERAVEASEQNYLMIKERFDVGGTNILDLQTANTQYITAQINYINAVYNYILAQKQILYSIGELK